MGRSQHRPLPYPTPTQAEARRRALVFLTFGQAPKKPRPPRLLGLELHRAVTENA